MLGRSKAQIAKAPVGTQTVQVWGVEPIGASIAESLQAQYGAAMASQSGQLVGWGQPGALEVTATATFAPVQDFVGGLAAAGGPFSPSDLPGLPGTHMPPGLLPYGVGGYGIGIGPPQ